MTLRFSVEALRPGSPSAEVAIGLLSSLLARPDIYSVVAEIDGRLVGSNFLWENATIAGVGPITIDPKVQNSQIGKQLMNDVLDRARTRGVPGVRLVQAAYHNRSLSLYAKLGFTVREPLAVLQGKRLAWKSQGLRSDRLRNAISTAAPTYAVKCTATSGATNSSTRSSTSLRAWSSMMVGLQGTRR